MSINFPPNWQPRPWPGQRQPSEDEMADYKEQEAERRIEREGLRRNAERVRKIMGDNAEMILDGLLCEECGGYIDGEEPGYPRKCEDCE